MSRASSDFQELDFEADELVPRLSKLLFDRRIGRIHEKIEGVLIIELENGKCLVIIHLTTYITQPTLCPLIYDDG